MTTKIKGTEGIEFPDASVQSTAADAGPAFLAYQAVPVPIPTNVFTPVPLNNQIFDTANGYDPVTGIFTAPIDGFYSFTWSVGFMTGTAGMSFTRLKKNANTVGVGSSAEMNALGCVSVGAILLQCTAGDAVNIEVFQNADSPLHTDNTSTTFSGFLARKA